jgi:hypothetical protein
MWADLQSGILEEFAGFSRHAEYVRQSCAMVEHHRAVCNAAQSRYEYRTGYRAQAEYRARLRADPERWAEVLRKQREYRARRTG